MISSSLAQLVKPVFDGAKAENGAWPLGLKEHYPIDEPTLEAYANAAIP